MVTGFAKFRERFQDFKGQYVIIGGTACDLLMESEELTFRATKDIAKAQGKPSSTDSLRLSAKSIRI